jgi:biotin carboxyl carrier protein
MKYEIEIDNKILQIELEQSADKIKAVIDGKPYEATLVRPEQNVYTLIIDNRVYELTIDQGKIEGEFTVRFAGRALQMRIIDRKHQKRGQKSLVTGAQSIPAPMPGRVIQVMKSPGDSVTAGESLMVVEAMKMQNDIGSPKTGTVVEIKVKPGQTVAAGEVLAVVE